MTAVAPGLATELAEISKMRMAVRRRRDAVVTFAALLLIFAAADDITTDNATAFPLEYSILIACTVWLGFLTARLLRGTSP
jgi:hypothetical protein